MRNHMTACQIFGIVVAGIVVLGILINVPDIGRYIKLKTM